MSTPRKPDPEQPTATAPLQEQAGAPLCLLVLGSTVATVPLPHTGEVVIGRSGSCDVALDDPLVSRQHARLRIGARIELCDLGSRHGTRVGSQQLTPEQPATLSPGDVFHVGNTLLVVQLGSSAGRPRRLWSHGLWEVRLEDECARAQRSERSFAVMRVRIESGDDDAVEAAFTRGLRTMDVLACYAPGEYEVMLVDAAPQQAAEIGERLRQHFRAGGVTVRIGTACYPRDARTPEALVAESGRALRGRGAAESRAHAAVTIPRLAPIVERVAAGDINVVLLGETGAGKEVVADWIHRLSPRAERPMLRLNCAALSEHLLESELFGHEKGAFTGALAAKPGLLETAEGGTVFVDEVGDLPASIQVKLLRVIEQREVLRVGSLKPRAIDVRFIAATNRDLEAEVALGRFRPDLFFRLNGIALVIPPLRDRVSEIAGLAEQFVARACVAAARPPPRLAPEALALLEGYGWPGNVRELRNLMERAVLLCSGDTIQPEHLPADKMAPAFFALGARPSLVPSLARPRPARPSGGFDDHPTPAPGELTRAARAAAAAVDDERARITAALERCGGNQTRAAKLLGISRGTLVARLKEFGLARPRKTDDSD